MLVTNELEPLAKLSGVSNGGGERQDGAVSRADDALQSVALGTIERVNLVEPSPRNTLLPDSTKRPRPIP
ncbi:hypothetical protein TL16_g13349, partial [Triparma laevis f. inornata]